jgi:sec-independent protein translocase protein TatA
MFGLGTAEILVIAVIGLLLFGHRLPDLARLLGSTVAEFKRQAHDRAEDQPFPPR